MCIFVHVTFGDLFCLVCFQGNSYPGQGNPYGSMYQGMGGSGYQAGNQQMSGSMYQGQYGFSGQQGGGYQPSYGGNPVNSL